VVEELSFRPDWKSSLAGGSQSAAAAWMLITAEDDPAAGITENVIEKPSVTQRTFPASCQ